MLTTTRVSETLATSQDAVGLNNRVCKVRVRRRGGQYLAGGMLLNSMTGFTVRVDDVADNIWQALCKGGV